MLKQSGGRQQKRDRTPFRSPKWEICAMGIRKRFNEVFGVQDNVEDERKRFVERANQAIFHHIDTQEWHNYEFNYPELF